MWHKCNFIVNFSLNLSEIFSKHFLRFFKSNASLKDHVEHDFRIDLGDSIEFFLNKTDMSK